MTVLQGSIQLLKKTEAQFLATDPVLLAGQIAISSDSTPANQHKVGDGITAWSALSYTTSVFARLDAANTYTSTNTFSETTHLPTGVDKVHLSLNGERFMHTIGGSTGGVFQNLVIGYQAGNSLTSLQVAAYANTIIGRRAAFSLTGTTGTQGRSNVIIGYGCAEGVVNGAFNTIVGTAAAAGTTNVSKASIYGWHAGNLMTGDNASIFGYDAAANATGAGLAAFGAETFTTLTTNIGNAAFGYRAAYRMSGEENTFGGYLSGGDITGGNGSYNTSWGCRASNSLRTGITNTDIGRRAGEGNVSGSHNVNLGADANNGAGANYDRTINIGRSTFCTASNQMNIANSLYGADIYNAGAKFGIGVLAANIQAALHLKASTTSLPSLKIEPGVAPTGGALVDGVIWYDSAAGLFKCRENGVTRTL